MPRRPRVPPGASETLTFNLREVPRALWVRVRSRAFEERLTARDWVLRVVTEALSRPTRKGAP